MISLRLQNITTVFVSMALVDHYARNRFQIVLHLARMGPAYPKMGFRHANATRALWESIVTFSSRARLMVVYMVDVLM